MKRREVLKAAIALPVVAVLPLALVIPPKDVWRIVETTHTSGGGGKGGGPLVKTFNYFAVSSKRNVAISLEKHGNVMPDVAVLDAIADENPGWIPV